MVPYTVWVSAFCGVSEEKKKPALGQKSCWLIEVSRVAPMKVDSAAVVG